MNSPIQFTPPKSSEYHAYYEQYINRVETDDFLKSFEAQPAVLRELLGDLETGQDECLHEPYTWTLKQVMGHLIDCERIFSTRMLRIAVGDKTPIPGIEQNSYVANLDYSSTEMDELLKEFEHLRAANVLLVNRLPAGSLEQMGTASDNAISAKANLFILAGHVVYHLEIMRRRLA